MKNFNLVLGYDLDVWSGYGKKEPVTTDVSVNKNSHIILSGNSGSGKSYAEKIILARLDKLEGLVYFCDFKQDDSFSFLQECPRYYPYLHTEEALDTVYEIMQKRQSGEDTSRLPITLIWDEYMANILSLQNLDKKRADKAMRKVSEILMLGRSLGIRLCVCCQRPDAVAFPTGSRLNYGIIIVLGTPFRSILEMLMPKEFVDQIEGRKFNTGEGVVLLQGSDLRFIKTPTIKNNEQLEALCIDALTRTY